MLKSTGNADPLARPSETNTQCRRRRPPHRRYQVVHATYFSLLHLTVITVTAIELLVKRVWYRTLAGIRRMFSGSASPKSSTIRPSHFARLPVEILEMIILYLIYDTCSLLSCSLTCHSWYTIAVPHLHRTLNIQTYYRYSRREFKWPRALQDMHNLGLLPLVKKFHIGGENFSKPGLFSPMRFNWCTLHYFAALTNVQELAIDYLDIPSFIPRIQQYFGHFLPTVNSLVLREPRGSRRQIIYFIGVFKHLEDLKLIYDRVDSQDEPEGDPTLVPPFIPPLRGRLVVTHFTRVGILEDMIDLFGGIRFRHMSLFNVVGTRLLLDACAETLETLQLHPTDPRGKELSLNGFQVPTDEFTAVSFIRDFDLSRNKFLRALEVMGRGFIYSLLRTGSSETATGPLAYALSTITSSAFTEVIAFYRDYEFLGVEYPLLGYRDFRRFSPAQIADELGVLFDERFKVFREMRRVRDFRLVLCADSWDGVGEHMVRVLRQVVEAEKAKRGFDDTFPEPLVIHSTRGSCCRGMESYAPIYKPWIPL